MHGPLCTFQRIGDELRFVGAIDASNAEDLAARATAEVKTGVACLDLSQVRFFGAAGVRMLFAVHAAALDGGMRVVCSPEVMRTLRVCRVTRVDGLPVTAAPDPGPGGGGAGR